MSQSRLDKIAGIAKERGLSSELAQQLVNQESEAIQEYDADNQALVKNMQDGWLATAKSDKEFGGQEYPKNAEIARRVLSKYGTPEFNAILSDPKQGLFGNHPELVRVFVRIGKAMSEDQLVLAGTQNVGGQKSTADKLYSQVDGQQNQT